ncbi:hypothetical protein [Paenibacillus cremeus]|uniref:PilZ domain-containing protein n=1 Tax=Paenibacillus cremeus TaxID=2163881 RepID=A0A559KEB1_9BACL|nr:hypothetical protein [Paenibacillus cremeus]TVY10461.1 hypothetical protein FPZ49_08695 [Paenibacillus cremeus]
MKEIHMLYKGRVCQGRVAYEGADVMELRVTSPFSFKYGESVVCYDFKRRLNMRVIQGSGSKLIVAPEEAEIFRIGEQPMKTFEELYRDESKVFTSFKLNTFGTISKDFKTYAVRFADVSRLGFGFEIDDFSIRLNQVYDSMIICNEETIHPKLIVRYAHILEKKIRYGAEIHAISNKDLNKLRYYIASKQF